MLTHLLLMNKQD